MTKEKVPVGSEKSEAVRVAVRVRPFNKREIDLNTKCCIEMDTKNGTCILKDNNLDRPFQFDFVFDQE